MGMQHIGYEKHVTVLPTDAEGAVGIIHGFIAMNATWIVKLCVSPESPACPYRLGQITWPELLSNHNHKCNKQDLPVPGIINHV